MTFEQRLERLEAGLAGAVTALARIDDLLAKLLDDRDEYRTLSLLREEKERPSEPAAGLLESGLKAYEHERSCDCTARDSNQRADLRTLPRGHELPSSPAEKHGSQERLVRSAAMLEVLRQVAVIARTRINVLIIGETGVGKDVLARRIHEQSDRSDRPFLRLNCAALVEPLLEDELLDPEDSSGVAQARSALQAADGGTAFLDEIDQLPKRLQLELLELLENQETSKGGGSLLPCLDVRFIAATSRALEAKVLTGEFRRELYYRLARFTAFIPPLRERREDILPLALELSRQANPNTPTAGGVRILDQAAAQLLDYPWPGNVRELRNVMESALVLSGGGPVAPEHLPRDTMRSTPVSSQEPQLMMEDGLEIPIADLSPKERKERQRILDALVACGGNQSKAAERLAISRSSLLNRLDAYRIGRPRKRPR